MITLYADGSSSLKSGYCGWAVAGDIDDKPVSFCGYLKGTNQVAELMAVNIVDAFKIIYVHHHY